MTRIVDVHEAKKHLSMLLEQARAWEKIVLAKAGKPSARPMPLAPIKPGRQPGRFSEAFFDLFRTKN